MYLQSLEASTYFMCSKNVYGTDNSNKKGYIFHFLCEKKIK